MKYLKYIVGVFVIGAFIFFSWKKVSNPQVLGENIPHVSLIFIDKRYDNISASTPFDALRQIKVDIESKQYDFGVFIESIGGRKNTSELSWIYFVNNESGDVAADKKILHEGDIVQWRYIKPAY